jgi:phosphoribosyl-AMP cyclohydrolase
MFKKRTSIKQVEEGKYLSPKFNKDGLIPVITTDYKTKEVLMHGFMNKLALQKTIETGEAFYWSRSRKALWHKGATSGFVQNAVWITVDIGQGASCHVGYRSCFYRSVPTKTKKNIKLKFKEKRKKFNPNIVYKGQPNPTKL